MDFYDWFLKLAEAHPFLAFCVLWLIGCLAKLLWSGLNRILRTIKVVFRGWPPAHLDADGDWKPEPRE